MGSMRDIVEVRDYSDEKRDAALHDEIFFVAKE